MVIAILTQRLHSYFESSKELRLLSGKIQQLRELELNYAKIVHPSLRRASQVICFENQMLTLSANNSAIAAKLRQMMPELIKHLQQQGYEVTGIQVKVQVTIQADTHKTRATPLSLHGKSQLSDLAKHLPDSPLKQAIQRLAGIKYSDS